MMKTKMKVLVIFCIAITLSIILGACDAMKPTLCEPCGYVFTAEDVFANFCPVCGTPRDSAKTEATCENCGNPCDEEPCPNCEHSQTTKQEEAK